jgi:hypothetical protein
MAAYSRHLVIFLDFLGFSEALKDRARAEPIHHLLTKLSAMAGDFWAQSEKTENGHKSDMRPAISVFSDNIVISFPLDASAEHGLDEGMLAMFLPTFIAYIAWNGFQSRLLIRGGAAIGDAYHAGGVVFGPALIEAYEAERTLAIYPRVALAPSITHADGFEKWKGLTTRHDDGVTVIGYMQGFITRSQLGGGWFHTQVKPWVAEVRAGIASEIERLSAAKDIRALSKWSWFRTKFEQSIEKMPPQILEMDVPPTPPNPAATIS